MEKIAKKLVSLSLVLLICVPLPVSAEDTEVSTPAIIITELQTGAGTGSDEFIELYNVGDEPIDIAGWQLRYRNATATSGSSTLIADIGTAGQPVTIAGHGYLVLHTENVPVPMDALGQTYSAKLSAADKTVSLFAPDLERCLLVPHDAVAWGVAPHGEGTPVPVGDSKGERLLRRYQTAEGQYVDTSNNDNDFALSAAVKDSVTPQLAQDARPGRENLLLLAQEILPQAGPPSDLEPVILDGCELPKEEPELPPVLPPGDPPAGEIEKPVQEASAGPSYPARNVGLKAPVVTELLPNPAKPRADAADEFIELYNSNEAVFELSGFMLEVGLTTKRRYVFPMGTLLQPRSFMAFFSAQTKLALSNTQGQARLLDPFGRVIAQTEPYQGAKDDQAWASISGVWSWTASPTPNGVNVLREPAAKKKAVTKASANTSSVKGLTASARPVGNDKETEQAVARITPSSPLHPGVLALVGVFAVVYGAYEYRRDVANKLHQFRSNREARRKARQQAAGR